MLPARHRALARRVGRAARRDIIRAPALQNCATRLLHIRRRRGLRRRREASVAFGRHGVELAVRASNSADGAAALANLVAAAGANKELALARRDRALLRCVEDGASDDELCLQACRGLGNLTFGWGVDAIKEAIGGRGATAVVAAARRPSAALFRWAAHAAHNFAVRSAAMLDLGAAGATAALLEGLRAHAATPRAQEAGCKALAYVVLDHDANRAAAVDAGALEAAAAALRAHAADLAVVEAALTLLCCAVGSDAGAADLAARCGAHTAAIAALTTHCAAPAAGALASSALWRLACLTRTILESAAVDRRAAVAAELEGAGVRALFASEATTRRRWCAARSTPASRCSVTRRRSRRRRPPPTAGARPRRGGRAHRLRRRVPGHHRRGGVALRFVGRRGGLLVRRVARGVRRAARSLREQADGL